MAPVKQSKVPDLKLLELARDVGEHGVACTRTHTNGIHPHDQHETAQLSATVLWMGEGVRTQFCARN